MRLAVRHLGVAAAVLHVGCVDSGLGPDIFSNVAGFTTDLALEDLQRETAAGMVRVAGILDEEGILLRRVELGNPDDLTEPEELRAPVVAVSAAEGFLTLDLQQLDVTFDVETEFATSDGEPLSVEEFVAKVQDGFESELPIWVRVRRGPADAAQGPDDPAFHAAGIRVIHDGHERGFALNVSDNNLLVNSAPPPDAFLDVLSARFEIRASEGLTEIVRARDDLAFVDFEGAVLAVDLDDHSFILANGTVVQVVEETAIRFVEGDRHRLASLDDVVQALSSGLTVYSAGDGALVDESPRTIVAAHVVWEVDLDLAGFEGFVASVDVPGGTFTLGNGTTVRVDDHTRFKEQDAHPHLLVGSLAALEEALSAGEEVVAFGEGELETEEPRTILAFYVGLRIQATVEDFAADVESVDLQNARLILAGALVLELQSNTVIKESGDLLSLQEVSDALNNGDVVMARGEGEVLSEDPLTIAPFHVEFTVRPPTHAFDGTVASVQLDAGTFTLTDDTDVRVTENTIFDPASDVEGLGGVAEALDAGHTVTVVGEVLVEVDPTTGGHIAYRLRFTVTPVS